MKPIVKNIIAVIVGWIIGSFVNMSLIELGHYLMPVEGLDTQNMDSLATIFPTLEPKYFIFPFLGHAIGTLIGACIAGIIATKKMRAALIVGILFFLGGVAVNIMITGPIWFVAIDILLAYIPMALLGGVIATKFVKS